MYASIASGSGDKSGHKVLRRSQILIQDLSCDDVLRRDFLPCGPKRCSRSPNEREIDRWAVTSLHVESDLPKKAIQIRTASALDRGSGSRLVESDGFEIGSA